MLKWDNYINSSCIEPLLTELHKGLTHLLCLVTFLIVACTSQYTHAECGFNKGSLTPCWYLGTGIGFSRNTVSLDISNWHSTSDVNSSYQFFLGRKLSKNSFLELSFHDLGETQLTNTLANQNSTLQHYIPGIKVGYQWDAFKPDIKMLTKIGIAQTNHDVERENTSIQQKNSTSFTVGLGVEWNINNKLFSRIDLESFDTDATYIGVAIGTRFGEQSQVQPSTSQAPLTTRMHTTQARRNSTLTEELSETHTKPNQCHNSKVWDNIYFAENSSSLSDISQQYLLSLSNLLKLRPKMRIAIHSHTDNTGNNQYNLELSKKRSQRIIQFMSKQGVEKARLHPFAYGGERPLADNATAHGRAENRRTEFTVLKNTCL